MVVDELRNIHSDLESKIYSGIKIDSEELKELFRNINNFYYEMKVMENNQQILITKIKLLETRCSLLEGNDLNNIMIVNKILYDILDDLIFLQLADDVLKIEDRCCPKCNEVLDEEKYQKMKIDVESLLNSMRKIQLDLEKGIKK